MASITVQLHRQSPMQTWGFRLQGGRDFQQPLSIKKVGNGTPAWGQVQDGDGILAIGSYDAAQLSHAQASQMIKNSGNILQLTVQKGLCRSLRPSGVLKFSPGAAYQHGY